MLALNHNIKKLRSLKGMNQTEFAELFELSRSNIASYEEGRAQPKMESVIKIAGHFNLSLDDFISKELTINDLSNFPNKELTDTINTKNVSKHLINIPYLDENELPKFLSLGRTKESIRVPKDFSADLAWKNNTNHLSGDKGIEYGDILLLTEVNPKEIQNGQIYSILIDKEIISGICNFKKDQVLIKGFNKEELTAINQIDIRKSWKVIGVLGKFNFNRELNSLQNRVENLERELSRLTRGL